MLRSSLNTRCKVVKLIRNFKIYENVKVKNSSHEVRKSKSVFHDHCICIAVVLIELAAAARGPFWHFTYIQVKMKVGQPSHARLPTLPVILGGRQGKLVGKYRGKSRDPQDKRIF